MLVMVSFAARQLSLYYCVQCRLIVVHRAFSCCKRRGQHYRARGGGSKLFVITKVLFDDDSHQPPGPVAVEMLRQKCPELSEAEAEALLRKHANDMDMALRAAQQTK